jgi:lysophospholipase L1-like esterase
VTPGSTSRRRVRDLAVNLAVAGAALLVTLAVLELGLRVLAPLPPSFLDRHPALGWFHNPGEEGWFEKACFRARVTMNRHGFRDRDYPHVKSPDVYRIVILGDSFTEALQVDDDVPFPKVLETMLNGLGGTPRIEVLNLGVSGYSTAQELLLLRLFGPRYRPDLVMLAFFNGNDLQENSAALSGGSGNLWTRPYFVRGETGMLELVAPPELKAERLRALARRLHVARWTWEKINQVPALNMALWSRGFATRGDRARGEPDDQDRRWHFGFRLDRQGVPPSFQMFAPTPSAEWESAWRLTEALIAEVRALSEDLGADFLLLSLPDPAELADRSSLATLYKADLSALDLERPARRLQDIAFRHRLDYLPLRPHFHDRLATSGLQWHALFNECDGHWNATGHRWAATAIADKLTAEPPWSRPRRL